MGWTAVSRTPWRDIGYRRPKRWPVVVAGGILSGAVLKLAMKAVVTTSRVFGAAFAVSRSLVPLMIAHAAFDLTAPTIIYFDAEATIAHLVLR